MPITCVIANSNPRNTDTTSIDVRNSQVTYLLLMNHRMICAIHSSEYGLMFRMYCAAMKCRHSLATRNVLSHDGGTSSA